MSEWFGALLLFAGLGVGFYAGCAWRDLGMHEELRLERDMMYRILESHGWLGRIHVDDE